MAQQKLILDYIYDHEATRSSQVFLTQPTGGGKVIDYTWAQMMDEARRMAAYLASRGFEPGARVAMLSKNCAHFFTAELAVWMAGFTTVAIFPTEGPENIRFVMEHSEARLLFVGKLDTWPQQAEAVPAGVECIALPLAPQTGFETWDAIIARTEPIAGRPMRNPDDLAMIIYTSGSTGQPKGAMHSFGRITRATELRGSDKRARPPEDVEWRALSYLPLAHVYERACIELSAFYEGKCRVYFSESLATFVADIRRARPTLFASVPRLWLKFQQGVFSKFPPKKLDLLLSIPIVRGIIGKKVLTGLGLEEVRIAASASAPIPADLLRWYRRLGLNLLEGYGMTEDFGYSHCTTATLNTPGYVGTPYTGVEVRLDDDGEILVKSPGCMIGYYKRPDLDAECFTADGFFRTGDLGERSADGQLKITGRKKELFKTAKGKYVAPAPIENLINSHPIIELSMVSGVGRPSAYAVVVLDENLRGQVGDPAVKERVGAELSALLKSVNGSIADYERLQAIVVAREPWSIENGCLTPTMKIKRSRIESAVAPFVDGWYATTGPVIWA